MNEEILRIQKMVAEGKVTPEEAAELVESVRLPRTEKAKSADAAVPAVGQAPVSEAKSSRKVYGAVGFAALVVGAALLVTALVISGPHSETLALAASLLGVVATVLGFIGWRSPLGKIGAVGGLVLLLIMFLLLSAGESPSQPADTRGVNP